MRRTGWLAIGVITVLAATSSVEAVPNRVFSITQSKPEVDTHGTRLESVNPVKSPALARNTTPKPTEPAKTETTKPQAQDKQTMSRCWKRLMNMVRELNHAHRANKSSK